jgi:hypothetical protein
MCRTYEISLDREITAIYECKPRGKKTVTAQVKASQLSMKPGILSAGEGSARWTRTGKRGDPKVRLVSAVLIAEPSVRGE